MKLTFIIGGNIRRVSINNRKVMMEAAEMGFEPLIIDLDKLEQSQDKMDKMKLTEEQMNDIRKLAKLGSEEEMARDITKDFQRTGWRLVKKE